MSPKTKKSAKADASSACSELEPVAALVDNVNDDFAVALAEAIELIVSQDEFQDIMKADPIGISSVAGVAETDAGSKAWICYV